jgi:hypothetical protein
MFGFAIVFLFSNLTVVFAFPFVHLILTATSCGTSYGLEGDTLMVEMLNCFWSIPSKLAKYHTQNTKAFSRNVIVGVLLRIRYRVIR